MNKFTAQRKWMTVRSLICQELPNHVCCEQAWKREFFWTWRWSRWKRPDHGTELGPLTESRTRKSGTQTEQMTTNFPWRKRSPTNKEKSLCVQMPPFRALFPISEITWFLEWPQQHSSSSLSVSNALISGFLQLEITASSLVARRAGNVQGWWHTQQGDNTYELTDNWAGNRRLILDVHRHKHTRPRTLADAFCSPWIGSFWLPSFSLAKLSWNTRTEKEVCCGLAGKRVTPQNRAGFEHLSKNCSPLTKDNTDVQTKKDNSPILTTLLWNTCPLLISQHLSAKFNSA